MFKGLCLKIRIARKEYHKLLLTNNSNNRYGVVFDLYIFYSVLCSKCTDKILRVPWDALFVTYSIWVVCYFICILIRARLYDTAEICSILTHPKIT